MWKTVPLDTGSRVQLLNITDVIQSEVIRSGIKEGICHLFVPHTTAGITVNENADPDVARDMIMALSRIVPESNDYRHFEGNSTAHVKASLMGFSVAVPVVDGSLDMGRWQGIYFCEFDGPRKRSLKIGIL